MRRWSIFAIGLGVGLFAGSQLASSRLATTALWTGVAATVAGLVLLVASQPEADPEPGSEGDGPRVPVSGLGGRVEDILRLAEEQAADHLREAEKSARRVHARVEAGLWVVLREGDDGRRYEVARLETREDAVSVVAALEARGHLQRFSVAPAAG